MTIRLIVFGIVFIIILLACLLLGIAALLIWAPGVLIDTLRSGITIACVIGGIILLIPIIIFIFGMFTPRNSKDKKKGTEKKIYNLEGGISTEHL